MMPLAELIAITNNNMVECHPMLINRTIKVITSLYSQGVCFAALTGYRTPEHQHALWMQGRFPVETVNTFRSKVPLNPITEKDNKIVTQVNFSWHCVGLAVDIVEDGDPTKKGIQWSWANTKNYLTIGKYAKMFNLEWGGTWQAFKDLPHLQLTNGKSLSEAQKIARNGKEEVWNWIGL